ncbi:MAG: PIG-L family deacetylase [Frankiaceae bacterium]|nr:PIG-L family deacetylase [Frankiaceae bacterium]MBV9369467.1 PIG-L family deacetylase [Frankiales bacterium]
MSTVLFFHAHPDDEAIFTALTMRRLADQGHRVVLVTATAGELGVPLFSLPRRESVGRRRVAELEASCAELSVSRLVLLGRRDSGMPGDAANRHRRALARAAVGGVARRLADLAVVEGAAAIVHYDGNGIYGHPDHVAVHQIGSSAAALAGVTSYEATVDREYIHFVEQHLVEGSSPRAGRPRVGAATVEITTALQGTAAELAAKRAAMAAHSSQIPPDTMLAQSYDDVYGLEWYIRRGAPALLETLGNAHLFA